MGKIQDGWINRWVYNKLVFMLTKEIFKQNKKHKVWEVNIYQGNASTTKIQVGTLILHSSESKTKPIQSKIILLNKEHYPMSIRSWL